MEHSEIKYKTENSRHGLIESIHEEWRKTNRFVLNSNDNKRGPWIVYIKDKSEIVLPNLPKCLD